MKTTSASLALALALTVLAAPAAMAETLLVERVQTENAVALPTRGSTMSQVQAKFGAPAQKLAPVAGPNSRKHNPPITRWVYPTFEVYFEYNHVIDAVLLEASPTEVGPAPVRQ